MRVDKLLTRYYYRLGKAEQTLNEIIKEIEIKAGCDITSIAISGCGIGVFPVFLNTSEQPFILVETVIEAIREGIELTPAWWLEHASRSK
jgi:hypothetical protein